jgi:two-component system sensor histidine kinase BaeS
MFRSLRSRLVVGSLLPIMVAVGVAAVLTLDALSDDERDRTTQRLRTQARAVGNLYAQLTRLALSNPEVPPAVSKELRQVTAAKLYYQPRTTLDASPVPLQPLGWEGVDWAALDRDETQTVEFVPPGTRLPHVVVLSGVFITGDRRPPAIGAIALARPVASLSPAPLVIARRLAPAFLIGALVSIALALTIYGTLARPLTRLARATRGIAEGDYAVRLDRARADEIGDLNRAFADMAERLEEADEHERLFLMRVSHELRTPLTAIQGHVGALADGIVEEPEERAAAYAVIDEEAARLGRLVTDLLDLAKLEARRFTLRVEQVDLRALLEHGAQARRAQAAAAGVELIDEVGEAPTIMADGDRILQIVTNLLENAVRWTPAGGVVRLGAEVDRATVRIVVADSGPGVRPDKREAVLRPFYSEGGTGTGLGLAIAAELLTAMGGRLDLDDAPEGGARFTCTLPRRFRATAAPEGDHASDRRVVRAAP